MSAVKDNLPLLLVVEDEKNTRDGLRRYFDGKFDIYLAPDVPTAMNVLETQPVDVLLTDLRLMGGTEGLDLLTRAQSISHPPVSVLMTAYGSEKVAVQAMKRGAYDYITKPLDLEKLEVVLTRALRSRKVESENERLRQELDKKFGLEKLIGNSPAMVEIYDRIRQVAPTRATVLIEGESGTGKELVAQSLHMLSPRKAARFVAVHCAALSPQLLESELFGHEKGSFTGAAERRIGRFEEASHGTIFLDEIGEIDAATQVKLLRALGEQTIQRVGSNQTIQVDVRVVAATNKNLETLVREGKFREDLFYRLDVVPIHLPPLRERREDIPLLAQAFLHEFARQNQKKITGFSTEAQDAMQRYDWPGNVRELRAALEHAVALCRGERIGVRDLPHRVLGQPAPGPRTTLGGATYIAGDLNLEKMEKAFIEQALRATHGNITEAAKLLGISRRTLHRKLKGYEIKPGMNTLQTFVHGIESSRGAAIIRLAAFAIGLVVVFGAFDLEIYRGLDDPQSMDNAQLARQLALGRGYTTKFIRPAALGQLGARSALTVDAGGQRVLPDTYNAPGYPFLLAAWYKVLRPHFDETGEQIGNAHSYAGDRSIPWLNQLFLLLTAGLVFLLGRQLFDSRVAWMSLGGFLVSDIVWKYSITGLSTGVLMFLITAALAIGVKIYSVGEPVEEEEDPAPFWPAWWWTLLLGVVLGLACLTRLHLLILLAPVGVFLFLVPRANFFLGVLAAVVVLGMVAPWFWHMNNVSGSPLGSNAGLLQLGPEESPGNQIYRTLQPSTDTQLLKNMAEKEMDGFLWHFLHAWDLLGANPLALLFAASLLHNFRRRRAQALRWLIVGCGVCLVAANNLCLDTPESVSEWNVLVLLLPVMLVIGSAFFFILLDRLNLEHMLLERAVAIGLVLVASFPLLVELSRAGTYGPYNYPPYAPAYIKLLEHYVPPGQWITSDMPWATAWYGDHAALWLPDSTDDFDKIHTGYCPTGMLIFTQIILDQPALNLTSGEDKDWLPFVTGAAAPPNFPLSAHISSPKGAPTYILWMAPTAQ